MGEISVEDFFHQHAYRGRREEQAEKARKVRRTAPPPDGPQQRLAALLQGWCQLDADATGETIKAIPKAVIRSILECVDTMKKWLGAERHKNKAISKFLKAATVDRPWQEQKEQKQSGCEKKFRICEHQLAVDPWSELRDLCDLKLSKTDFEIVDNLALPNRWWTHSSGLRLQLEAEVLVCELLHRGGHTFARFGEVKAKKLSDAAIAQLVAGSSFGGVHMYDGDKVSTKEYMDAELGILQFVKDFRHPLEEIAPEPVWRDLISKVRTSFEPTEEQMRCLSNFCEARASVITGPGGTGKSSILEAVVQISMKLHRSVEILVPTHRVRKLIETVIERVTERATEEHERATEEDPDSDDEAGHVGVSTYDAFNKARRGGTEGCVYIIEEASMADTTALWNMLSQAREAPDTRVVLCGDISQCRPIGPGQPFFDVYRSGTLPTVELTRSFRAEAPDIMGFCRLFRHDSDERWTLDPRKEGYALERVDPRVVQTFFVEPGTDPTGLDITRERVKDAVRRAIETAKAEGIADEDVCVVTHTNEDCELFHKVRREVMRGIRSESLYVAGDAVIFRVNTAYYKNCDGALVQEVEADQKHIHVRYRPDSKEQEALEQLVKAGRAQRPVQGGDGQWTLRVNASHLKPGGAITVYAAQGGQWLCVIPVFYKENHGSQSDKVYTAASRTQRRMLIVGTVRAWNETARASRSAQRRTILKNEFRKLADRADRAEAPAARAEAPAARAEAPAARGRASQTLGERVWTRYNGCVFRSSCHQCEKSIHVENFRCGLVVPVELGGRRELENLRPVCRACGESLEKRSAAAAGRAIGPGASPAC